LPRCREVAGNRLLLLWVLAAIPEQQARGSSADRFWIMAPGQRESSCALISLTHNMQYALHIVNWQMIGLR
jgi:hypothetical protein